MMYKEQMAFAIKHNGEIVKENKDQVHLPFGSEYSLLVKNLNSKKAIVKISIDGVDVCDGGFVVYGNDSIDIERFVKDNLKGNRFKFIERTGGVEKHRGIGIEDGLIRVEFNYALPEPKYTYNPIITPCVQPWNNPWNDQYKGGPYYGDQFFTTCNVADVESMVQSSVVGSSGDDLKGGDGAPTKRSVLRGSSADVGNVTLSANATMDTAQVMNASVNDAGVTVPGSISDQKFKTVSDFPVEDETHVIVMKILGYNEDNKPVQVVTPSRRKPICSSCGKVNRKNAKFCSEDGTSLEVI